MREDQEDVLQDVVDASDLLENTGRERHTFQSTGFNVGQSKPAGVDNVVK